MYCVQCGSANADKAKYCSKCGNAMETESTGTAVLLSPRPMNQGYAPATADAPAGLRTNAQDAARFNNILMGTFVFLFVGLPILKQVIVSPIPQLMLGIALLGLLSYTFYRLASAIGKSQSIAILLSLMVIVPIVNLIVAAYLNTKARKVVKAARIP